MSAFVFRMTAQCQRDGNWDRAGAGAGEGRGEAGVRL